MDVEADALVANAQRRYEDSYAYHALLNYLVDVGEAPYWAWGELPWSDEWKTGWAQDIDHRVTDAERMRDHMAKTGSTLIQVAADYTQTDIDIALTFTKDDLLTGEPGPVLENGDTSAFLDYYTRDASDVTARPGGIAPEPVFPPRAAPVSPSPDRPPYSPIPYPPDNERLQLLRQEREIRPYTTSQDRPPLFIGGTPGGGAVEAEQPPEHTFVSGESDGLEAFVQEHGELLRNIELEARSVDPGLVRPWTDLIGPAWLSCPSVIRNRAELIGSVADGYQELRRSFDAETGSLANYWVSPGAAGAYFVHARTLSAYLEDVTTEARETGADCEQAAKVLAELRNEYAEIGYERIDEMRQRYYEHLYGYSNVVGAVAGCFSPGGRAQALVNVVLAFNEAAQQRLEAAGGAAREHLRGERVAVSGGPTFGNDPAPAPGDSVGGYGAWDDGTQWQPVQDVG